MTDTPHIPHRIVPGRRVKLTAAQFELLRRLKPAAVALLELHQITECEIGETTIRTSLTFTFPPQVNPYECAEFDRQIFGMANKATMIIDGTLEGLPHAIVHLHRVPCHDFRVGKTFWIDASLFHDVVTDVREVEVTVTAKDGPLLTLSLPDGSTIKRDVDELRVFNMAWVDDKAGRPLCVVAPPSAKSDDTRIYLNKTGAEALRNVLNTFLNNADTAVSFTAVANHTNQAILLIPSTQADFETSPAPVIPDKPRRFTSLEEVAAYHGLQIAPAIPLVNGLPSDVNAVGWTISLTTPRYTKDRALTPEEQAEYAPLLLADLLYGVDSRCEYDSKVYQYVTEPTTVLHDPEGMWCVLYLK